MGCRVQVDGRLPAATSVAERCSLYYVLDLCLRVSAQRGNGSRELFLTTPHSQMIVIMQLHTRREELVNGTLLSCG